MPEIPVWIQELKYPKLGIDITLPVHLDPKVPDMDKKLIINVAPAGSLISPKQNPKIPKNPEEIAKEVIESYKAGASMWHVHCRREGLSRLEPECYKEMMDLVFPKCPGIITDICMIFSFTKEGVEHRLKPIIDPLRSYGPQYCDCAVVNPVAMTTGYGIFVATYAGGRAEVEYLEEKGVKPDLGVWNPPTLDVIKGNLIDTGIVKKPYFMSVVLGFPWRSLNAIPTTKGLVNLVSLVEALPEGSVWQAIIAGRNWLPMTVASIMLGADIVRVGMEDVLNIWPHKDDMITSNVAVVKLITDIARLLGREIATPDEARKTLGIK